eukprot:TRINITY_DN410_c0_g1_i12.p1 TRINITY_DN410_c0_g1~~TRINITY_DN410_c0_g1_i12.p1  ORF type:complete len:206 (+),score=31.81 TRINITY_DN410_c0_g1_i12:103-720(+)
MIHSIKLPASHCYIILLSAIVLVSVHMFLLLNRSFIFYACLKIILPPSMAETHLFIHLFVYYLFLLTSILVRRNSHITESSPSTGYMYGKGVYFADCVSKSANYCHVQYTNNEGVMLLCEVALGNMAERLHADTNIKLKQGENSCFGLGQYEPNPSANHVMSDGVIFPVGKMARTKHNGTLLYNEFIVYDVCQVKVRYLLRLKWS